MIAETLGGFGSTGVALSSLPRDDPRRQAVEERLSLLSLLDDQIAKLAIAAAEGKPVYQFARYDGGVKGTEVGMTYFYTDLVAKAWPMERGAGVPSGKVPGFVSNLAARTPMGHCRTADESGRLWFGLREEAVRARQDRIELGSLATRLFSLVKDAQDERQEVEPSYSFGRIMWWWDRHYVAMADYEPQYHRLDQLMRWGAAIAWLVNREGPRLPEISFNPKAQGPHFFAWLTAHPELKWHWDIPVVRPPGVNTEALLTVFSSNYEDCGTTRYWGGGISSPESAKISTLEASAPSLEEGVARAGARLEGTDFSATSRAGTIAGDKTFWKLGSVKDNAATVEVVANGRSVWSFSTLKAWVGETAQRHISLKVESAGKNLSQRVEVQGLELGELFVSTEDSVASVTWEPSVLDHVRFGLTTLQERLLGNSVEEAAAHAKGASFVYNDSAVGKTFLRFDGTPGSRWMTLEKGATEPTEEMAFRLGQPSRSDGEPTGYTARFTEPPAVKNESGAPAEWLRFDIEPGGPARMSGRSGPPGSEVEVLTADAGGGGPTGKLYLDRFDLKRVQTRSDDPLFGLRGTQDGSALLIARAHLQSARQEGKSSGGRLRAVRALGGFRHYRTGAGRQNHPCPGGPSLVRTSPTSSAAGLLVKDRRPAG